MTIEHFTQEQAVQMARDVGLINEFNSELLEDGSVLRQLHSIVNLAAEQVVAEYKKDAERLEWIESRDVNLRAAIDAAMEREGVK